MAIGRGKKLTVYKYLLTFPKWWPSLALMSHSSHIPILIAYSILCLVLPHHWSTCTIFIDFWSHLLFLQARVHASPWAFRYRLEEINHNSFTTPNSHPQSHTILCILNYLLTTPPFPVYLNSMPTYSILHTFLWKPTNQSSRGVVDDMAIHSPYNSPFTDLNTI